MSASRKGRKDALRCNFTSLRQAARHVSRFYDAHLAATGLGTNQYTILANLVLHGPMTMSEMTSLLILDRATLGHNLRPLERDGLLTITIGKIDRREREVRLTDKGLRLEAEARPHWELAQALFEREFGENNALAMRQTMYRIARLGLVGPDGKLAVS
ncbi:MAG TPA: MarR family transcriptional regulator [Dyella sp.]|uniref:MarR family winged helix-turn-helix transcriptional regulator n=1 Tax=Dyella sp. TaxID=1869338 RepID=UPI002F9210C0